MVIIFVASYDSYAHFTPTSNVGHGKNQKSFILDRHELKKGFLKGYSSNSPNNVIFKDAKISELILEWDECLLENLETLSNRIFKKDHNEDVKKIKDSMAMILKRKIPIEVSVT